MASNGDSADSERLQLLLDDVSEMLDEQRRYIVWCLVEDFGLNVPTGSAEGRRPRRPPDGVSDAITGTPPSDIGELRDLVLSVDERLRDLQALVTGEPAAAADVSTK
jgi:hypothetical protein